MASKPPPSDDKIPASADDPLEPELKEKLAAKPEATNRPVSDRAAAAPPSGDQEPEPACLAHGTVGDRSTEPRVAG